MKRKFDRSSSWRCVEYWLKKGYSEEEGQEQISLKQSLISSKQQKGIPRSKETCEKIKQRAIKRLDLSYWIDNHGESGIEKYNQYMQRFSDNGKKSSQIRKETNYDYNSNTPRRKEFWSKRGYTEEHAVAMVAQTQSTFSLHKCIEKYGDENGKKVWEERQKKWMLSYSKNNVDVIRKKQKENAHIGFYSKQNIGNSDTLLFYLLLLDNNKEKVLKYGLTKQSTVQKRWGIKRKDFSYEVLLSFRLKAEKAIELEYSLRNMFKKTSKTSTYNLTEIVDLEHYDYVNETIKNFLRNTDE